MKKGNNKRTMFLLGILIICVIAWFYTKQSPVPDNGPIDSLGGAGAADSAMVLLQKAQAIKFDFSVLDSAAFGALVNRALPLLNLPVGKDNPFAPAP